MNARLAGVETIRTQLRLASFALAAAAVASGCQSLSDRPTNPNAVNPIVVTEGSGPAGAHRVWAFRTTLGWTCVEVDSGNGSNGGCDPTGGPPVGAGVGRNERGVVVNGVTAEASAVSAAIHDASGAITTVALFEIGSTVPGAKVGVANLGPAAHPTSIDYLDAGGATVDSARLP